MQTQKSSLTQAFLDSVRQWQFQMHQEYDTAVSNGDSNASLIFRRVLMADVYYQACISKHAPLVGRLKVKDDE